VVHILARRVLGAEVSRDEAGLLADAAAGDARSILARLEERSRIKRSAPGLRPDKHFQTRLVIAEVVFDAKGLAADGPIAKMQLIDKMIASQRAQAAREGELVKAGEGFAELIDEMRLGGPVVREFFRRAERLRLRQRNHLQAVIQDEGCLAEANAKLDSLYAKYYRTALDLV